MDINSLNASTVFKSNENSSSATRSNSSSNIYSRLNKVTESNSTSSITNVTDTVQLSKNGKLLSNMVQALKDMSVEDAMLADSGSSANSISSSPEKIAALKEQVANGSYYVSTKDLATAVFNRI